MGRYAGVLVALVLLCVYLSIAQDVFLTWDNLTNIAKSNSVVFVLAIGATFVVISAGIDLSAASATAAAGMILGLTMDAGWSIVLALAATVLFGILLGLFNGILITKLRISFLVVTLGTLSIYQSFALVVNDGQTITVFGKPGFSVLSDFVNSEIGPFPILLIFDLGLLLLAGGVLRYTGFGRALFAVGSNPEAARLNGIDVAARPPRRVRHRRSRGRARLGGAGRPSDRRVRAGRPDPAPDRRRRGADRRHRVHGGRGRRPRHADRGHVPRRRPERADPLERVLVLARHRQRRDPDRRGGARRPARPRLVAAHPPHGAHVGARAITIGAHGEAVRDGRGGDGHVGHRRLWQR